MLSNWNRSAVHGRYRALYPHIGFANVGLRGMRNSFAVDQPQVHRIKFSRYDGAIRGPPRQADPEASLEATDTEPHRGAGASLRRALPMVGGCCGAAGALVK